MLFGTDPIVESILRPVAAFVRRLPSGIDYRRHFNNFESIFFRAMNLPVRDDYLNLISGGIALMDVRAPVEFVQGSIGNAVNLPLLVDDEREEVGKCYKERGQDEAIRLGHELVNGDTKSKRVQAWKEFVAHNPETALFCFRGGLRSQITQQWLAESGVEICRVDGGYKALRNFLIAETTRRIEELDVVVLGGRTGTAKTRELLARTDSIDLEGIANHRGSAFGRWPTPQPSQINFENALAIELIDRDFKAGEQLVVEDEGTHIGVVSIPKSVVNVTAQSPLVVLETTVDERVDETLNGYINDSLHSCINHYGEVDGFAKFDEALRASLDRIKKRLGGDRFVDLQALMSEALHRHQSGDVDAHREWIERLLVDYYDPMYDYQLSRKQDRIVFKGTRLEVKDWLNARHQLAS